MAYEIIIIFLIVKWICGRENLSFSFSNGHLNCDNSHYWIIYKHKNKGKET